MSEKIAVFLDLQGTLGGEGLGDIMGFSFYPCAYSAIKVLNDNGLLTIVITNQSHISRGLLSMEDYNRRLEELRQELNIYEAHFDGVYCCPHSRYDICTCKKPLTGLIEEAEKEFIFDRKKSYVVGDMGSVDMVLSKAIGAKGVLVRTGMGEGSVGEFRHLWKDIEPAYIASDVLDAAKWIIKDVNECRCK